MWLALTRHAIRRHNSVEVEEPVRGAEEDAHRIPDGNTFESGFGVKESIVEVGDDEHIEAHEARKEELHASQRMTG